MLSVTSLTVARGGVPVLEGVTFDLHAGEALVLRGPNGIGKTTLLRTIAGLQEPHGGTLRMQAGGAYGSHADGLKGALTVTENLAFWAQVHGAGTVPEGIYEAFNLGMLRDRMAAQLSAGQKRRLGLARLGVVGAELLLLDEPTVSLDTASVALFAAFITGHLARGGAALMATHIDLGVECKVMDLTPFKAAPQTEAAFDEAFV